MSEQTAPLWVILRGVEELLAQAESLVNSAVPADGIEAIYCEIARNSIFAARSTVDSVLVLADDSEIGKASRGEK